MGVVVLLVVLALVGTVGLLVLSHPAGSATPASSSAISLLSPPPATTVAAAKAVPASSPADDPVTHGDLVVTSGQTVILQPSVAGKTYYQGGNITVESGGTLIVRDVTLSFVEYVSNTGTPEERLSHIYHFDDAGTVSFVNATLTTDVEVINAYAKLNVSVTGVMTLANTTFSYPGWLWIDGAGADVTLNSSAITWNPIVASLSELSNIYGDTLWAPTIFVLGGAHLNLFSSVIEHTYADNTITYGYARPTSLENTVADTVTSGTPDDAVVTGPADSANLTLDWSYPAAGAASGYVWVSWSGTSSTTATTAVSVSYDGTVYALGTITIPSAGSGTTEFSLPAGLLTQITGGGMLDYLNYSFGDLVVVETSLSSGTNATVDQSGFQLNTTGPAYNDYVSGAGSQLSAIDSTLDFSWALPSAGAYSQATVYPWNSQKLIFTDGSTGHLANITTFAAIPGVFSASAIVPDASSQVYFYRWAEFNVTGRDGLFAVENASVAAYYAYNSNQANNVTANGLNAIATADPALWGYVQYWDSLHGVSSYAKANSLGQAFVLLASSNLTGPTLPDGTFLGGYHVGIFVPSASVAGRWFNWSVSPYPQGVANQSFRYGGPDFGPAQQFQDYFGAMTLAAPVVTANGTATATVRLGQLLGFEMSGTDAGTATITQVGGAAYYNDSGIGTPVATFSAPGLSLTAPGQKFAFNLTWLMNDSVTGLNGTFPHTFLVELEWNNNHAAAAGGIVGADVLVTIEPSTVTLAAVVTTAPTTLNLADQYITSGTVHYNGTQAATVTLWASPTSGAAPVAVGVGRSLANQHFSIDWFAPLSLYLSPGTSYTLSVNATYNHVSAVYIFPGTYSVPAPSAPAKFILYQKFFGLPLWEWLVIAAIVVAAILAFLLVARRTAAGKLVECGECGNLIPETATVCPKCGAEFEKDLIRCSRCASTIPADSKVCPECGAQLLGKPGEAEADPERQGYDDFTQKYRAEAKRELGENYTESAFWDWWKRQPTYTSFSQWKLQQSQGAPRPGMAAPPAGTETAPTVPRPPARGGGGAPPAGGMAAAAAPMAPLPYAPGGMTAPPAAPAPAGPSNLKPCPNCGKEIPPEYLVCPFCGAVTQ